MLAINIIFNSGLEKEYLYDTQEDVKEVTERVIKYYKDVYENNKNGSFHIETNEDKKVLLNTNDISGIEISMKN